MRAHLDHILEGLPCGVLVIASDGQISRANPEALRLMKNCEGVSSLSQLDPNMRELLEWSRGDCEPECKVQNSDGSIRWIGAQRAMLEPEHGAIVILRDVRERKHLEETQAGLRREQALAEMSAVLAHEIRNPLGSLELFAGLLAESELDAERGQWVEHVQAGLRTLAATVNNVLHFHSLPEPERAPVDLGQLLDWARDFFPPLARQARVALSLQNRLLDFVFGRPPPSGAGAAEPGAERVAGHAGRRVDRTGGPETSSGARQSHSWSPTPGRGFPEDLPDFRARLQHAARAVRGWAWRCAARSSSSTGGPSAPQAGRTRRDFHADVPWLVGLARRGEVMNRVLVVDDEAGMRAALEARFLRRGWRVETAANASEGLEKFRRGMHPLIVTDIRMPGRATALRDAGGAGAGAAHRGDSADRVCQRARRGGRDEGRGLRLSGQAGGV